MQELMTKANTLAASIDRYEQQISNLHIQEPPFEDINQQQWGYNQNSNFEYSINSQYHQMYQDFPLRESFPQPYWEKNYDE